MALIIAGKEDVKNSTTFSRIAISFRTWKLLKSTPSSCSSQSDEAVQKRRSGHSGKPHGHSLPDAASEDRA